MVRWLALWIGLAALAVVVIVRFLSVKPISDVPMYTRAMPGFEIDVAGGDVKNGGSSYSIGKFSIGKPGGFPATVG